MNHQNRRLRSRPRHRRRGLSLVEVMVGVMITAALLTAAAAAFIASSAAIEMNDQFFRASQTARVTLHRIMSDVRKCKAGLVDPNSLELTLPTGENVRYAYDEDNNRITMTFPDEALPTVRVMARDVTKAEFRSDGAVISMVVNIEVGENRITHTASAMPRRTVTYK